MLSGRTTSQRCRARPDFEIQVQLRWTRLCGDFLKAVLASVAEHSKEGRLRVCQTNLVLRISRLLVPLSPIRVSCQQMPRHRHRPRTNRRFRFLLALRPLPMMSSWRARPHSKRHVSLRLPIQTAWDKSTVSSNNSSRYCRISDRVVLREMTDPVGCSMPCHECKFCNLRQRNCGRKNIVLAKSRLLPALLLQPIGA